MPTSHESPGGRLDALWRRLAPLPAGSWLFSRIVGRMVPYTGALGCHVRELRPGYARVTLRDRRANRNHLGSVHATALATLGEFTSGLAMLTGLGDRVRGIVRSLTVEYEKKARGQLVAECTAEIPDVTDEVEHVVEAEIRDTARDVVARVRVTWNLRPVAAS